MADRLDSGHNHSVGGLSIWVALATFFANAGEKEKAGEALRAAKARRGSGESDGSVQTDGDTDSEPHPEVKRKDSSAMERLGHALGMR
jgi:hypothetical protein